MASKSKNKLRVSKNKGKNRPGIRPAYVVLGIALVALAGIGIIYFSNAANSGSNIYTTVSSVKYSGPDGYTTEMNLSGYSPLTRIGKFRSGAIKWTDVLYRNCYTVASNNATFFKKYGTKQERYYVGDSIIVAAKSSCNL